MPVNYPDPVRIVYPSAGPPKDTCKLTTRNAGRVYSMHEHSAYIDKHLNGVTSADQSHFHRVVEGRVLPDESDGHTHVLTRLPCGAGG